MWRQPSSSQHGWNEDSGLPALPHSDFEPDQYSAQPPSPVALPSYSTDQNPDAYLHLPGVQQEDFYQNIYPHPLHVQHQEDDGAFGQYNDYVNEQVGSSFSGGCDISHQHGIMSSSPPSQMGEQILQTSAAIPLTVVKSLSAPGAFPQSQLPGLDAVVPADQPPTDHQDDYSGLAQYNVNPFPNTGSDLNKYADLPHLGDEVPVAPFQADQKVHQTFTVDKHTQSTLRGKPVRARTMGISTEELDFAEKEVFRILTIFNKNHRLTGLSTRLCDLLLKRNENYSLIHDLLHGNAVERERAFESLLYVPGKRKLTGQDKLRMMLKLNHKLAAPTLPEAKKAFAALLRNNVLLEDFLASSDPKLVELGIDEFPWTWNASRFALQNSDTTQVPLPEEVQRTSVVDLFGSEDTEAVRDRVIDGLKNEWKTSESAIIQHLRKKFKLDPDTVRKLQIETTFKDAAKKLAPKRQVKRKELAR